MKILIAVPTFETITPDTFKSIYELDSGGNLCAFEFVRGYDCAAARNRIAEMALDMGVDYVLMVDNDVVLQQDTLVNMLDDPKDVCLGYYAHRNAHNIYDGKTSICRLGEYNYTLQYPALELTQMRIRGEYKIEIHGGGMGCALINTEVFKKIRKPWFVWVNYDNGEVLSEDLYFCEKCAEVKIPIYTDTRACCGHLLRHLQWAIK